MILDDKTVEATLKRIDSLLKKTMMGRRESEWDYDLICVARALCTAVDRPSSCWTVHFVGVQRYAEAKKIEEVRIAVKRGVPVGVEPTFEPTEDAWLLYAAQEFVPEGEGRCLGIEVLDPYEPFDTGHLLDAYLLRVPPSWLPKRRTWRIDLSSLSLARVS